MKLTFAVFALIAAQSCLGQDLRITGQLKKFASSQVVITDGLRSDTILTPQGAFKLIRPSSSMKFVLIDYDLDHRILLRCEFFPKEGAVYVDSNGNVRLEQPEFQVKYDEFRALYNPLLQLKTKVANIYARQKERSASERALFDSVIANVVEVALSTVDRFITENKSNAVGAYVFAEVYWQVQDLPRLRRIYDLFDTSMQNHLASLQIVEKKLNALAGLAPGSLIRPFSLSTMSGTSVTLESFTAKYVALDFWGTWCPPCIRGMDRMKQYYDKYKNKIEFIGIACRDNPMSWHRAISDLHLNWTQVLDSGGMEGLDQRFSVVRFPTKILIDPQGKVVQVFTGEQDDFYLALDRLLN